LTPGPWWTSLLTDYKGSTPSSLVAEFGNKKLKQASAFPYWMRKPVLVVGAAPGLSRGLSPECAGQAERPALEHQETFYVLIHPDIRFGNSAPRDIYQVVTTEGVIRRRIDGGEIHRSWG